MLDAFPSPAWVSSVTPNLVMGFGSGYVYINQSEFIGKKSVLNKCAVSKWLPVKSYSFN